jgi:hypothetical protein
MSDSPLSFAAWLREGGRRHRFFGDPANSNNRKKNYDKQNQFSIPSRADLPDSQPDGLRDDRFERLLHDGDDYLDRDGIGGRDDVCDD